MAGEADLGAAPALADNTTHKESEATSNQKIARKGLIVGFSRCSAFWIWDTDATATAGCKFL
jgi:hypothetical protein